MKGIKVATIITTFVIGLLAGSTVGVVAQDEQAAATASPVYFTFTTGEPANFIDGTFDESTGELRGTVQEGIPVEASDPRVSGLAYSVTNGNREVGTDGIVGIRESRAYRIVNDDGAWTGTSTYLLSGDPSVDEPPAIAREMAVLTGEGAYEGLSIVATVDYREGIAQGQLGSSGEGVIYGIAAPPVPDVPDVPAE